MINLNMPSIIKQNSWFALDIYIFQPRNAFQATLQLHMNVVQRIIAEGPVINFWVKSAWKLWKKGFW